MICHRKILHIHHTYISGFITSLLSKETVKISAVIDAKQKNLITNIPIIKHLTVEIHPMQVSI